MLTKIFQPRIIKIIRFITLVAIAISIFSISLYSYIFYGALSELSTSSSTEEYAYRFAFIIFGFFLLLPLFFLIPGFILTRHLNTRINKDLKVSTSQKIILVIMTIMDMLVMVSVIKFFYNAIA